MALFDIWVASEQGRASAPNLSDLQVRQQSLCFAENYAGIAGVIVLIRPSTAYAYLASYLTDEVMRCNGWAVGRLGGWM